MDYKVVLSPRAQRDLLSIEKYLVEKAPDEAAQFLHKLVARASTLHTFPAGFPKLWSHPDVHQLTFGNYSIVFGIQQDKKIVKVHRFWHTAQSPRRFSLEEKSGQYGASVTQASP